MTQRPRRLQLRSSRPVSSELSLARKANCRKQANAVIDSGQAFATGKITTNARLSEAVACNRSRSFSGEREAAAAEHNGRFNPYSIRVPFHFPCSVFSHQQL